MRMQAPSRYSEVKLIRETVTSDKISIPTLLKLCYKIIKIAALKLIILRLIVQYIDVCFYELLDHVIDRSAYFPELVLLSIAGLILAFMSPLLPMLALLNVYDTGHFGLESIVQAGLRKLLKYLWTNMLVAAILCVAAGVTGATMAVLYSMSSVGGDVAILIIGLVFLILLIWLSVPFYFVSYLVLCTEHYGLSAIRIAIKMIENQWWKLFGYIVVIHTAIFAISVPVIALREHGYLIAYFLYIPIAVVVLFGEAYNLLLYKHVVAKIGESNIDLSLKAKKKQKKSAKMCKHCGEKLAMAVKVCTYCGKELSDEDVMLL